VVSNQAESNAMSLKNQRIERVIQIIALIPIGKVVTYGQVAEAAQLKGLSRWVGKVLSQLPAGTSLPWHRVINSAGRITNPNRQEQIKRLIAEGVHVNGDRVSLPRFRWNPEEVFDESPKS
jgi:methylated-DNA-protein-cysteine methyltransferase-like protein